METLSIQTDFPSVQTADFSVLPSPSTFFSNNAVTYPSPTFDQYPISATDYHQHFLPPPAVTQDERSDFSSSPPGDVNSLAADTPSPASSFPSTPTGSPIPQNLTFDQCAGAAGKKEFQPSMNKQLDPSVQFEVFDQIIPSQHKTQFDCGMFNGPSLHPDLPPPPRHSHAHAHATPYAPVQPEYYTVSGGEIVYVNGIPQIIPQQQAPYPQQAIPYSLGGGNFTYAIPQSTPGPTAIETPLGTYYFVPNVNPVAQVQAPPSPPPAHTSTALHHNEPVQLPSSPPFDMSANVNSGFVQLPNGLTAGVAIAQATNVVRSASGQTATVVVGNQKIRLPVGQGKRGSTKRPSAKKDQVKKFICPHVGCGRAFARNFNMQSHFKSHLGIREFSCPHCPKKFSRRHDRARHCSAVHDSRVDRDGNIISGGGGGRRISSSSSSTSFTSHSSIDGGEEEEYDDTFDEDKNFQLSGFSG
ncbi:uncharacterized protein JCM6883_006039 [Sporobolomyces salmoneus]|uniref:uncharacterized protein n=1 Tax=Sporobolomyces salmoneus TaxID=183962 RepID=UPI00316F1866